MNGKLSLKGAGGRCPVPGEPAAGAGGRAMPAAGTQEARWGGFTFLSPFSPLSSRRDRFPDTWSTE